MIAACCWEFLEPYLARNLGNRGLDRPTPKQVLEEFAQVWPEMTATIGVQEPHAGTIRFKWLVRLAAPEMAPFLDDPEGWIASQFGGGKFKVNLHHGLHFVNTRNFGPAREPRWAEHRGDKGHVVDGTAPPQETARSPTSGNLRTFPGTRERTPRALQPWQLARAAQAYRQGSNACSREFSLC